MAVANLALLEERRNSLNKNLAEFGSPNLQLIELTSFLSDLLASNNKSLLSAYFTEFIPKYISLLYGYSPFGIEPSLTEKIYSTAEKYLMNEMAENVESEIKFSVTRIKGQFDELKIILEGGASASSSSSLQFPVLERSDDDEYFYGFLETITINISKRTSLTADNFIVVPDFGQNDRRLNQQIKSSWSFAKNYFASSIKTSKHFHEVVIRFNKKYGVYEGSSLGIVLTIGLIQELIRFYNLREVVTLGNNIASTGTVNEKGKIDPVGINSIQKKVEAVFYSGVQKLIIPSNDLSAAKQKLNLLSKKYPKRDLEIIGVDFIPDLIDRRSLVSIKKQNLIKWGAKKTYNNKLAFAAVLSLIATSSYFFVKDFDDNPVDLIFKQGTALARNKYGKVVWEIDPVVHAPRFEIYSDYYERFFKFDLSPEDGMNDLYISSMNGTRNLQKLDYQGNVIWEYELKANVKSDSESFQNLYNFNKVIEIYQNDKRREVVAVAQQKNYYPNTVVKVNTETGSLADSIFWHPGGITGAFIADVDDDDKDEFAGVAISNGYKCLAFFGIEYDKLSGTAPSPKGYRLNEYKIADFDWYILLPKTDYGEYNFPKYNSSVQFPTYQKKEGYIWISAIESGPPFVEGDLYYQFRDDLSNVQVIIGDNFAVARDKLVNDNILAQPFTDTKEYREIIKRQLLIWNGIEFVQMFPIKEGIDN